MLREFKEFALKGNVLDMAVGIIIGTAFGRIVTSLVSDIIMPPLGLLIGRVDFSNLYINLSQRHFESLSAAKAAGAPTINLGLFLNIVIDFVIVAAVLFLLIKQFNRLRAKTVAVTEKPSRQCPYCLSPVAPAATRCPFCTSQIG